MSTDPFLAFAPNLWQPAHPLPFRHLSWTEAILSAVACLLHRPVSQSAHLKHPA